MRPSWVRRATPASLCPDEEGEVRTQARREEAVWALRQTLGDVATSQGTPEATGSGKRQEGASLDLPEGAWPCSTSSLDFWSPDRGEGTPVFSHSLCHWL